MIATSLHHIPEVIASLLRGIGGLALILVVPAIIATVQTICESRKAPNK